MDSFNVDNGPFNLLATYLGEAKFSVRVSITGVLAAKVEKASSKSLKKTNVPGFRNGKHTNRTLIEKRLGGPERLYGDIFASMVDNELKLQSPYRVLYTHNHVCKRHEDKSWMVSCDLFVVPDSEPVEMSDFTFKSLPPLDVTDVVGKAMDNFVISNPVLRIKADADGHSIPAEYGDSVEISVRAFSNDKELTELSESNVKLRLMEGYMRPRSLLHVLVGKQSNDTLSVDDPDFAAELNLEQLTLNVVVNHVFTCEEQPVDDELAMTAGYDTLDAWRKVLTANAAQQMAAAELTYKHNVVVGKVNEVVKLTTSTPQAYVDMIVRRSMVEGIVKTEDVTAEKLRMLGICDTTFKLWNLGHQVGILYPTDLTKENVDTTITPSTVEINVYTNRVVDYLVEHSTWTTDDISRT